MASHGVGTAFDFRGTNAWEEDFKKASLGGNDTNFADNVDAKWYTGHGNSGGFTFKNTTHDDGSDRPVGRRLGQQQPRVAAARVLPGAA